MRNKNLKIYRIIIFDMKFLYVLCSIVLFLIKYRNWHNLCDGTNYFFNLDCAINIGNIMLDADNTINRVVLLLWCYKLTSAYIYLLIDSYTYVINEFDNLLFFFVDNKIIIYFSSFLLFESHFMRCNYTKDNHA